MRFFAVSIAALLINLVALEALVSDAVARRPHRAGDRGRDRDAVQLPRQQALDLRLRQRSRRRRALARLWKTEGDERRSARNTTRARIEPERQAAWDGAPAPTTRPSPEDGQQAVYVKPSSPFTSGNLHMGHVRDYSIGDAYARYRRARGDAVLLGFGFDAFGLPAEMAAIERGVRPADWVVESGERMLEQMKRLGYSFDYERVFYSSDESQYRWSQWLFVTLLEAGPDLPRRRHRRLVRQLPDDARRAPGRGRPLLALPQRGAPDPPPDLVPAGSTPYLEENDAQPRAPRELGRALAEDPALHPRPHRRGRARSRATPSGADGDRLHPARRRGRRGPLRPRLAAPPRGRALGRGRRGRARSSTSCAPAAGSAAPATPRRCR